MMFRISVHLIQEEFNYCGLISFASNKSMKHGMEAGKIMVVQYKNDIECGVLNEMNIRLHESEHV